MSYKEEYRRALELQGIEDWLGPKAIELERQRQEEYERSKKESKINKKEQLLS